MKYWLLFLVLAAPLAAGAKTITVSPGQSIQAAVDSASSGDLVEVLAGSYYQKVLVKGKSITLRGSAGAENTLIDGDHAWSAEGLQFYAFTGSSHL